MQTLNHRRPYQRDAIQAVLNHLGKGVMNQLVVIGMGGGKTIIGADLPKAVGMKPYEQMFWLVHLDTMAKQAAETFQRVNPDLMVEVEKAEQWADPDADIIIASVQTLGRKGSDRLRRFNPARARIVAIDECVPAGTMIGTKAIESIKVGDSVPCFNHEQSIVCKGRVSKLFSSVPTKLIKIVTSEGNVLICTPGHPVFQAGVGYVPAGKLHIGNLVLSTTRLCYTGFYDREMCAVRKPSGPPRTSKTETQLRKVKKSLLLEGMHERVGKRRLLPADDKNESEIRRNPIRPNESQQPNASSRDPRKATNNPTRYGVETADTGRQRKGADGSRVVVVSRSWLASKRDSPNENTRPRVSQSLQDRRGESNAESCHRDRRTKPQCFNQKEARPKKGSPFAFSRVEGVEVFEPGSDGTFGGLCPDGFVYNIEVSRYNNYFANRILVHNCQHSAKRDGQYATILHYFGALKGETNYDGRKLVCGFTGTPNRYDNIGLESILDKIVYEKGVEELVNEKWLSEMHCFRVSTGHSVAGVATNAGDFVIRQLERAVNTEARNRLVVRKYCEVGEGLPGLAFTVDVQHSHDLSETFNRLGIPAATVSGKTPSKERDRLREAHRNREIAVLCSCGVFNEGADFPWATVGLMCRPTRSPNFYWQQACRVDRLYPAPEDIETHQDAYSKDHAIIVDFVDNSGRHPLIEIASLFGLRSGFDAKGKSIAEAAQEIAALESKQPALNLRACLSLDEVQSAIERVEIFRPPIIPAEARKHSKYAWIEAGADTYHLALPSKILLIMHVNTLGQREIYQSTAGVRRLMGVHRDPAEAFLHADRLVPKEHERLVKAKMKWRCAEPTQAQCEFLFRLDSALHKKFGNPKMLYDFAATQFQAGNLSYSRGQISQMIAARKTAEG